jgi:hypothetical protein
MKRAIRIGAILVGILSSRVEPDRWMLGTASGP